MATAWALAVARCHGLWTPPEAIAGLAAVVWVIYLLDRSLDTLRVASPPPDLRHAFYLRHRRFMLGGLLPAGLIVLTALMVRGVPGALVVEASFIAILATIYLSIHTEAGARGLRGEGRTGILLSRLTLVWPSRLREALREWLPKEVVAGCLFALGCTTCARVQLGRFDLLLGLETLMLAVLFVGHLMLLSQQELPAGQRRHGTVIWLGATLFNTSLGALGGWFINNEVIAPWTVMIILALLLHGLLWTFARHRSAETFRVLADAALLLPALIG